MAQRTFGVNPRLANLREYEDPYYTLQEMRVCFPDHIIKSDMTVSARWILLLRPRTPKDQTVPE